MLISQKSKETIDACRFCWMCRHICPIGNATGQERNTARARALTLSLVERGAVKLADVIDNVYECALCGGCTNNCMTGWDPVKFVKEVRREAAMNGETPEYINRLLDNIESTGNVYGLTASPEIDKLCAALPTVSDTLLYIGTDTRYKAPQYALDAAAVLQKGGVGFTIMRDEPDSGAALDFLVGETEETRETAKKCADSLKSYKRVIVLDPADIKLMKHEWREWGIYPDGCEIVTFTSVAVKLIDDGNLTPNRLPVATTYQDSFALARDLDDINDGRMIVEACAELREMLLNRKELIWGGNTLMAEYMPDVIDKVAKNRWANAAHVGAKLLCVVSPSEYAAMSKVKPDDMEIMSVPELILASI